MTREAGNEVKDTDIIKTREVKDSRKAKIDALTELVRQAKEEEKKQKEKKQAQKNKKNNQQDNEDESKQSPQSKVTLLKQLGTYETYSYLLNEWGMPREEYDDLFQEIYGEHIATITQNLFDRRNSLSQLQTKIVDDATKKGADLSERNQFNLGINFFRILWAVCVKYYNNNGVDIILKGKFWAQSKGSKNNEMIKEFNSSPREISCIIKVIREICKTKGITGKQIGEMFDYIDANIRASDEYQIGEWYSQFPLDEAVELTQNSIQNIKIDTTGDNQQNNSIELSRDERELETDQQIIDSETETDEREPENIEDNTETEEDTADMETRHSAFGVQIDFDIPDFITVKGENETIRDAIDNDTLVKCRGTRDFIGDFKVNEKSIYNNKIGMYANPDKQFELIEDTVSTFIVLYCMANSLFGMKPDSTEEEVFSLLTKRDWLNKVKLSNTVIANKYFVTKLYVPDGGNT